MNFLSAKSGTQDPRVVKAERVVKDASLDH